MRKIKRYLSAVLVYMMILTALCISTVFADERIDQRISYSFDTDAAIPGIFSMVGKGGEIKIESGALKVTTNAGATESFKIDISDWTGASRKKGILTYSFDYKSDIENVTTSVMVGTNSTASGYMLAGLQKTRMLGYDGEQTQAVNDWLTVNDTSSAHRVTLQFDFSQKTYTCSMGGKTVSHPFDYFADKTANEKTYSCEEADKFVLYFRTYHKDAYSYCIDNFEAEYTERYVQENIKRCVNFIKVINNNGTTEEFKKSLIDISDLVGSYGDYNTQIVADDSMKAIEEIQKIVYQDAPFDEGEDDIDVVIPEVMEIIKANIPMISINSANTSAEIEYSLASYYNEYSADISFIDNYKEEEKQCFYDNIMNYRNEKGGFMSNDDIVDAISEAKFSADCYAAFDKYKTAHALTLPRVFDEYKNILEVDMSYIEEENRNQTLFILKTMTVNSYSEIPDALKKAYEKAKGNKEVFGEVYASELNQNTYKLSPGIEKETTVLPNEPYFTDLTGFEWAEEAVEYLYDNKIVSGKGEHVFSPADNVTREEFVKIVVCAFDIDIADSAEKFNDVDDTQWYTPYINAATASGIIQGHSDNSFGVGEYITREDVAVILYRTANVKNIQLEVKVGEKFKDIDEISEYAQNSVSILRHNEIINGVGEDMFEPKLNTNRAEAAVMIYKLLGV